MTATSSKQFWNLFLTLYGPDGEIKAEFAANNGLKRTYIYATKSHVPDYFVDDQDVGYRMITDHLGSVRIVINSVTGQIMQILEHDEFGRVTRDTNSCFTPFGFAGGLYEPDTKLVRFGAREYDPETGRWTSKDPILFNGGDTNLYGYVLQDPVNFVDVTGMSARDVERIRGAFQATVSSMNSVGARRTGKGFVSGSINNLSSYLNTNSFGVVGSPYYGCKSQSEVAREQLRNIGRLDDPWNFEIVVNPYTSHHWIRGTSPNRSDPILAIDPWYDSFSQGPQK